MGLGLASILASISFFHTRPKVRGKKKLGTVSLILTRRKLPKFYNAMYVVIRVFIVLMRFGLRVEATEGLQEKCREKR